MNVLTSPAYRATWRAPSSASGGEPTSGPAVPALPVADEAAPEAGSGPKIPPKPRIRPMAVFVDPPAPVAKLQRPVLLIPGGKSRRIGLPTIIHYLTFGGNNEFGGSYRADQRQRFEDTYRAHGGNVFCLNFTREFGSDAVNAQEIKQAIEDVRRLTGHDEIDVVAECKGSKEFREYIREGNDGVRNVVMVVPPNKGLPGGGDLLKGIARTVERFHLPVKRLGKMEVNPDSLQAMQSFGTDFQIGPYQNNPTLRALNSPENIERESKVFNSLTVISGEGKNLFQRGLFPGLPFPAYRGDNCIPIWSAYLPHAQNFYYEGQRAGHAQMNGHPEALAKLAEALTTDGKPAQDAAFVAQPPMPASRAIRRGGLFLASLAGRTSVAWHAAMGTPIGPVGTALGALGATMSAVDGVTQLVHAFKGKEEPLRASLGALGKFAQTAGIVLAYQGAGLPAAALIAGGLAVSAWSWY